MIGKGGKKSSTKKAVLQPIGKTLYPYKEAVEKGKCPPLEPGWNSGLDFDLDYNKWVQREKKEGKKERTWVAPLASQIETFNQQGDMRDVLLVTRDLTSGVNHIGMFTPMYPSTNDFQKTPTVPNHGVLKEVGQVGGYTRSRKGQIFLTDWALKRLLDQKDEILNTLQGDGDDSDDDSDDDDDDEEQAADVQGKDEASTGKEPSSVMELTDDEPQPKKKKYCGVQSKTNKKL